MGKLKIRRKAQEGQAPGEEQIIDEKDLTEDEEVLGEVEDEGEDVEKDGEEGKGDDPNESTGGVSTAKATDGDDESLKTGNEEARSFNEHEKTVTMIHSIKNGVLRMESGSYQIKDYEVEVLEEDVAACISHGLYQKG